MNFDKEMLKGTTTTIILKMLENEDLYGYKLIKKIKVTSENIFCFKEGTIYPILHNLEQESLITSYWIEQNGRQRKYYQITEKGKKHLKQKLKEWTIFSCSMKKILDGSLTYG